MEQKASDTIKAVIGGLEADLKRGANEKCQFKVKRDTRNVFRFFYLIME